VLDVSIFSESSLSINIRKLSEQRPRPFWVFCFRKSVLFSEWNCVR
jgi:hypothetical protein